MEWINLTPHPVNVIIDGVTVLSLPGSSTPARCKQTTKTLGSIGSIPLVRPSFGAVEGMPEMCPDTVVIVSLVVAQALRNHPDADRILVPQGTVRNPDGIIIGCTGFCPASHV